MTKPTTCSVASSPTSDAARHPCASDVSTRGDYVPPADLGAQQGLTFSKSIADLDDSHVIVATAAKWATVGFDRTWPFAIVDEAYQMRSDSLLPIGVMMESLLFVGDPVNWPPSPPQTTPDSAVGRSRRSRPLPRQSLPPSRRPRASPCPSRGASPATQPPWSVTPSTRSPSPPAPSRNSGDYDAASPRCIADEQPTRSTVATRQGGPISNSTTCRCRRPTPMPSGRSSTSSRNRRR